MRTCARGLVHRFVLPGGVSDGGVSRATLCAGDGAQVRFAGVGRRWRGGATVGWGDGGLGRRWAGESDGGVASFLTRRVLWSNLDKRARLLGRFVRALA